MVPLDMPEPPRLYCPSAGAQPEEPSKSRKRERLNLSAGSFRERELGAPSRLQLLQAALSTGRRGLEQEGLGAGGNARAPWQEAASPDTKGCPAPLL